MQHRWLGLVVLILAARTVQAGPLDRDATLFGPVTEWSVENSTFTGNPFNLEATVTFQHDASGEVRTGQMFYDAANTWRFRFTGTRTGAWRFTTSSADGDLSGLSGKVTVAAGADPAPRGFLVAADSKFARQVGETGLKGEALHVYMNMREPTETNPGFGINDSSGGWTPVNRWDEPSERAAYVAQATDNGLDAIFLQMNAQWFEANVSDANDLRSTNPDTTTFLALEQLITEAHAAGVQVVIWAWGDDARKWTPNFAPLDGQNGSADRRLQRYIAARLGPLPGWSMGYGFDLEEWASEAELQSWADSLHAQMGWDHLLWGRRRRNADLNAVSNDLRPDGNPADEFYQMAVAELNNSGGRPVIFERRFGYLRDGVWTAGKTRRAMWQFTMAGGAAGWFGFRAGSSITAPGPYPNPEQLQTHDAFWEDRLLVNMARHNELAPDDLAWALATPDLDHIVVYAQSTDHIALNLEAIGAPLTAVAIDAKGAYLEIQVGQFQPSTTHWDAPYTSDWALAIDVRVPEPASVGLLFIGSAILSVRSRRRWRNKSSERRNAMCRGIFCFVLCLGLAGAASADLVGYWPLDGDGMDASAGENNGTVQGNVEPAEDRFGDPSGAMLFAGGGGDNIDVGDPAELQLTGAMTIAAWVYLDSTSDVHSQRNSRILAKMGGARAWSTGIEKDIGGVPLPGTIQVSSDGGDIVGLHDDSSLPVDQWVHFAGVYTPGASLEVYLNGDRNASVTSGIPGNQFSNNGRSVLIGNRPDCGNCGWYGSLDEVRIYDEAISQAEIREIMEFSSLLLGDVNGDNTVNGLDVDPFVDALLNGPYQNAADMNEDQVVNGLDVDPFVLAVVGGTQLIPEPSTLLLALVALGVVGGWRK